MNRKDVQKSIADARAKGEQPNFRHADLRHADLSGMDLLGADLRHADLRFSDLWGANLRGANLRYADLRQADLRHSILWDADMRFADLTGANLLNASSGILQINNIQSGPVTAVPTPDGWHITIECWSGSPHDLADLCDAPDEEWPEARGEERQKREPLIRATLALFDAHAAYHGDVIESLREKWGDDA